MDLSGNLESFGVPEILQLLALQRKSGVLNLTRAEGGHQVLFIERGRIISTRDRRQEGPDPLLTFLKGAGYLSPEQADTILRIQAETGRDPVYVILSSGMISRDRLADAITQYTQQVVDALLHWTRGSYDFSGDERSIPKQALKVSLSIEELLMEGMRRMDEVATIKQAVLAPDLHLLRSDMPIDRSTLPRELRVVYELLGGTTPVETLVARSPLGEYTTYEAISALLENGHLVVDPCPPAVPEDEPVTPLLQAVLTRPARSVSVGVWAAVVLLTAASGLLGLLVSSAVKSAEAGFLPERVVEARHRADRALAEETFAVANGRRAASDEELIDAGLLAKPETAAEPPESAGPR